MQIDYQLYHWGPLLTKCKVQEEDFQFFKGAIERADRKFTHELSKLKHEPAFDLDDFKICNNILKKYLDGYLDVFHNVWTTNQPAGELELSDIWVNFQQKNEFRPPHIHDNCDASFVIYIDIPEEITKEIEEGTSEAYQPGGIVFTYMEAPHTYHQFHPNTQHYFMPEPGDMFIFPYYLNHFSMPFKSDNTRISISGNLVGKR